MQDNLLKLAAQAHVWHLTTGSGFHHAVFGEMYEWAHKAFDKLAEPKSYRAPSSLNVELPPVKDAPKLLKELAMELREYRFTEDWEQNLMQEFERDVLNFIAKLEKYK